MRPPYGDHDGNVVDIAHELGQEVVNWNIGNACFLNHPNKALNLIFICINSLIRHHGLGRSR